MDEASLLLGITGTGGVVGALIFYLATKGFRSKCMAMGMGMNVDVHQVKEDEGSPKNTIKDMTRSELEEIILDTLKKINTRRNSDQSYSVNIVMPNAATKAPEPNQQSDMAYMREMEDAIKDRIMFMDLHDTPETRSRSESEGSHKSHKSHKSHLSHKSSHSKHILKEEHIVIISEQL